MARVARPRESPPMFDLPVPWPYVWLGELSAGMPSVWREVVAKARCQVRVVYTQTLGQDADLLGTPYQGSGTVAVSKSTGRLTAYMLANALTTRRETWRLAYHEYMHLFSSACRQLYGEKASQAPGFDALWNQFGRMYGDREEAFALWGAAYLDPDTSNNSDVIDRYFAGLFGPV